MRATGQSLAGVLMLATALAAGCKEGKPAGGGASPGIEGPPPPPETGEVGPAPVFTEITRESGLDFLHVTGGFGEKLLPETMGAGAAFLDFDQDGTLDIFLVNSSWWPGHVPAGTTPPACALYRGLGNGRFVDAAVSSGASISLYGMGCAVADYDGDGRDDLYVTGVDRNVLLKNSGGSFRDVTAEAGAGGGSWTDRAGQTHHEWSTAAVWADVDLDGDVDLLVANYVQWTPENEIFTTLDGVRKAFTTPDRYPGLPCRLYLNDGGGRFEDATEAAGMAGARGKALGIAQWDFDGNRFPDFVVANDTQPNFLFMNRGGRLEEVGLAAGIAYDESGRARAGMGIDIQDHEQGGMRVAIGNFSDEPMSLYRWAGEPARFDSEAGRAGVAVATYASLTFGVLFADMDLDGVEDLVIANGHIEPDIARTYPNQSHAQSPQIFLGRRDGTFAEHTALAGADFATRRVGRGLAAGDIDGDGDLDLLLTTNGGSPALLRNDLARGANHHLRVRLHGKGKSKAALGAVVRLTARGVTQTRMARTGSSYLSQSEGTLTFGLGSGTAVDRLLVRWPSGEERSLQVPGVDRTLDVFEEAEP